MHQITNLLLPRCYHLIWIDCTLKDQCKGPLELTHYLLHYFSKCQLSIPLRNGEMLKGAHSRVQGKLVGKCLRFKE